MAQQDEALLDWLQAFYKAQCNGEWEHTYRIIIENADNPGWIVKIDVRETNLETKPLQRIDRLRSEADWVICQVNDGKFIGGCGVGNLVELLSIFKDWANSGGKK